MVRNRRNSNFRIPTPSVDYSEKSDRLTFTPVIPMQISRAGTQLKSPTLAERMENKRRDEEEQRLAELAEERRKADETRRKNNAEYYRKQQEERERQRRQEDVETARKNTQNEKERDAEREEWMKDIDDHPENYSKADQAFSKLKKVASKIPAISFGTALAKLGADYLSDKWFDVKDELGSGVISSVEINGENLQSRIGFAETKKRMADAHEYTMDMQEAIDNVTRERDEYMLSVGFTPEDAALNPQRYQEQLKRINDYNITIGSIQNQIDSNPYVKELDDKYKLLYSIRHADFGQTLENIDKNIRDQFTYDQYKDYVQNKRAQEQVNLYGNTLRRKYWEDGGLTEQGLSFDEYERKQVDDFRKSLDDEIADLQEQYKENRKHLAESTEYWDVRESYKKGVALNQNAPIWSKRYWEYEVPTMMGSSMSSEAQGRSMAILLASTGLAVLAPEAAGAILFLGQVASTPDDIKAIYDENYGETGMKRLDNLEQALNDKSVVDENSKKLLLEDLKKKSYRVWKEQGLSDKYLENYLYGDEGDKNVLRDLCAGVITSTDPRIDKALIQSTRGLQAQLDADNFRTGWETIALKVIMTPGISKIKNGTDYILNRAERAMMGRTVSRITTDAAGKASQQAAANTANTAERASKYANGFRRTEKTLSQSVTEGYKQGAEFAEAMGLGGPGSIATGAVTGTVRGAAHLVKNALPAKTRRALGEFEEALMRKYQGVYDKLMPTKEWARVAAKYGILTVKATAASSLSEAAEEAVLYLNEKEDFASRYGWDSMSWFDRAWNDIRQGGRVINSYLSLLGLTESELKDDQEYWANVKGGFVLGGGHTAVMSGVSGITGAVNEATVANAILRSGVLNREMSKINRAQYTEFARQAMAGNTGMMRDYIKHMQKLDSRRQDPEYTQEEYDDHLRAISGVANLAKDKQTRKQLQDSGLTYGTEKYATALADIYNLQQQRLENHQQRADGRYSTIQAYNNPEYTAAIRDAVESFIANRTDIDKDNVEELQDQRVNTQGMLNTLIQTSTRLRALMNLKGQINSLEDMYKLASDKFGVNPMRPDAKVIRASIDKQIERAKADMKELDEEFNPKTDKDVFDYLDSNVLSIEGVNYDELVEREQANALLNADSEVIDSYLNQVGKKEYSRRIDAIMAANERNGNLDWMVSDILHGDAVTELMSDLLAEAEQQSTRDEKVAQNENKPASEPFSSEEQVHKKIVSPILDENKQKYEARKAKAKERYNRIKERYKKWKRGNLSAQLPFQDAAVAAGTELIKYAEIGVYKFVLLVDDIKDISNNVDLSEVIPELKRIYIKQRAKYIMSNPDAAANMDSATEVSAYAYEQPIIDPGVAPTATSPLYKSIQDRINNDSEKIVDSISSHYDVIVDDNGKVTVYNNIQAIEDGNVSRGSNAMIARIAGKLEGANTSDESFRKVLKEVSESIANFPVEDYVKYRSVEGISEAIARNITRWVKPQAVENGIRAQLLVTSILLGNEGTVNRSLFPENVDQFIVDVINIRRGLQGDGLGLTILNAPKYLYGTDRDGRNIAVQADVIAADEKDRIYVIDVRTSANPIVDVYDKKWSQRRSIKSQTEALLSQVEQILNSKIKKPVSGLYLLPVQYSPYTDIGIKIDKQSNGRSLIPVKINSTPEYSTSLEDQKELAEKMINVINEYIDEYNSYVTEANKYTNKFTRLPKVELQEYGTVNEYSIYMNNMRIQYDDIVSRIREISQEIQNNMAIESTILLENAQSFGFNDAPIELSAAINRLEDSCRDLDAALRFIPLGKIATLEDKANVDKIYTALFEAQKNLDELLQTPDSENINVNSEEELIASAMEQIAQYPESFGKAGIFMRRWWLNNFVIGRQTNTVQGVLSVAEQFSGYVNTINSWVDTLHNHVVGELDNSRPLQVWYSTLLNNYFNELLNNATEFGNSQDPVVKAAIDNVVAKGRYLIQQFNDAWGAPTDEQFSTPPQSDVERINRMPVKWADLYGTSMMHSPAVDAMSISDLYYEISTQPDFAETARANFYISKRGLKYVNPRTNQSYEIKPGDLCVAVIGHNREGKERIVDLPLITNINNYPNANVQLTSRIAQLNRGNVRFIEKVQSMLSYIKDHPEYTVYTPISTNKGTVKYSPIGTAHNVSDFLFADWQNQHDLYDISISAKDNIGILSVIQNEAAGTRFYDIRTGSNLKRHLANYNDVYQKGDMNVSSGLLIYMYDTGDGQRIGVPMPTTTIGREDAAKLTYLIHQYLSGNRTYDGYDIMTLLKQRLYIKDPQRYHTKFNKELNMIIFELNGINIGGTSYNIVTQKSDIVDKISQMSNVADVEMLNQQLLYTNNGVFEVAYRKIKASGSSVTLPNGFKLTLDDFEHNNTGSTMLGYMMRNGIIYTRAEGLGYKLINFGNPVLMLKDNVPGTRAKDLQQPQLKSVVEDDDPFNFDFAGLGMTIEPSAVVNRTEEEYEGFVSSINKYFDKVLGENKGKIVFDREEKEDMLRGAATQVSVGVTTTSLIEISQYAPDAVGPHEAFHRIMELLLPDDKRESFYKLYKEHAKNGRNLDARAIAEGLCDLFVDYCTGIVTAKNAPWYKKPFKWFDTLKMLCGTAWLFGPANTIKMLNLWRNINAGEYANPKYQMTQERINRFNKLFPGGLYYTVQNNTNGHSANLQYIADSGLLSHMVRALGYYIMEQKNVSDIDPDLKNFKIDDTTPNILLAEDENGKSIIDNLCGNDLPEDKLTMRHLAFREILESKEQDVLNNKGEKIGTTRVYPKFDAISNKVAEYISIVCGEYTGKVVAEDEVEDADMGENLDVQNLNIDKYDKASYEINKLEGTTKKVKLFFATIPYTTRDKNGKIVLDTSRNIFGTPTYMPIDEVYNRLVNDLHDVKSIRELYEKLKKFATVSTMHHEVLGKLHNLVTSIYRKDRNGDTIINYDKEQFAIQIVNTLSSQKMDFVIANAKTLPNDKGKEISISQSSLGRDTYQLPKQWSKFLLSGQVAVFARNRDAKGNLQFRDGKLYPNGTDIFSKTVQFVQDLRQALSMSGVSTIDGVEYNVDSLEDIAKLKKELVDRLHRIGIIVSVEAVDHMLLNNPQLGDSVEDRDLGKSGLLSWLTLGGDASINAFLNTIDRFVFKNGTINQAAVKKGYSDIGFVKDLAKWQAAYNRITVDNRTLALNGKELHSISQNNAITRTLDALNTQNVDNPLVRTLTKFGFNLAGDTKPEGSIILKGILRHDPNQQLTGHTYIGFKTDNKGDNGSEYVEEATVDDYMAKMSLLQEGYMIFPTLADKGTWMVISGVSIPGIKFIKTKINGVQTINITNAPSVRFFNRMPYVVPAKEQLDQMLEYARTERLAIQRCMADLGYKNIPGYEDEGRQAIPEAAKVVNYHTKNKSTEPNGTRFLGLTLITVKENGKLVTYNLNDPSKSSVELLKLANDKFFSKSIEEQEDIMALTLNVQNDAEIKAAEDLGIVEYEDVNGSWTLPSGAQASHEFKAGNKAYYSLNSKFLNQDQIQALTAEFMRKLPHKEFGTWANIPTVFTGDNQKYASRSRSLLAEKQFRYRAARGLAIAALLNDATIRHMVCSEEALRCFIGHPGFFKVRYGKNSIIDSAYDIQKRIGGLISTGEDNVTRLPRLPETYTVAECNDYEVASTSNIAPNLEEMFVNGSVREMYAIQTGDWTTAYEKTVDELIEMSSGKIREALEKAKANGQKFAKSFVSGINVADGAAYITDKMCENLLRMRGAYNNAVREAFEILRSNSSWMRKRDAYKAVYDAVNIVPFKYTAYGFRDHTLNGSEVSDVAVPYYDKFALFTIFPDMATGNLNNIYQKMIAEGVDEMPMTSAVKVGSQGAVSYNGTTIDLPFNKYEQSYADVRRQLNTDPEEGDRITAGTQMIKIALQNLRLERDNYIDVRTGEKIDGSTLLKNLMLSINQLAINGALELKDMFCEEGSNNIDPEKLSKYLNDLLGARNATKAITDFILVTTDNNGAKKLVAPLAATTDATWIESIVISTVNKRVIDITTPGSSYTQRSVFAMEGKGMDGEGLIQGDGSMSKTLNNGEKLQMINNDGSMDAVITMDYFDEILFSGDLNSMSFEEKRKWLFDHDIIGQNAKANTIGYRIPTQAQSSIHALRFVDVMPGGKASIILPEEFTKITGSDKHQCSNVKKLL